MHFMILETVNSNDSSNIKRIIKKTIEHIKISQSLVRVAISRDVGK